MHDGFTPRDSADRISLYREDYHSAQTAEYNAHGDYSSQRTDTLSSIRTSYELMLQTHTNLQAACCRTAAAACAATKPTCKLHRARWWGAMWLWRGWGDGRGRLRGRTWVVWLLPV